MNVHDAQAIADEMRVIAKGDLDPAINRLSFQIIGAAIEVHKELGPGLLEGIYEDAMEVELGERGIRVARQVPVPIYYHGKRLRDQRMDMLIESVIIVENKSVAAIQRTDKSQLLSYLRAARLPLGLLFNFNVEQLRNGMHRVFNERAMSVRVAAKTSPASVSSCPASSSSR